MGTHKSRHNKGRKPVYKDHRSVATNLIARPMYGHGWYYNARTWWSDADVFKLGILAEANSDVDLSGDALGRPPKTLAWKARDAGLTLPRQWAQIIAPKRKSTGPRIALNYPYIITPRDEHAELLEINSIIPKSIPDHMRSDICQEIMIAILEGRTTVEMLKARDGTANYYIKKFYHDNYEQGGHAISFNNTREDWDSDAVASSLAAKEWHREQFLDRNGYTDTIKTYVPPTQFNAAWKDQIGRVQLSMHELGQYLSHEEVEEMLEAESGE